MGGDGKGHGIQKMTLVHANIMGVCGLEGGLGLCWAYVRICSQMTLVTKRLYVETR